MWLPLSLIIVFFLPSIATTRSTLPGVVRYANSSLTIADFYPDDYDTSLPEPNVHRTSIPYNVELHEPTGRENLLSNGFEYVNISGLGLKATFERMRTIGDIFYEESNILTWNKTDYRDRLRLFDAETVQAVHKKLEYANIPLSSSRGYLKLLWVPRYGLMSWAVSPLGLHGHGTPPHSHCDSDLTGEPLKSMTRGLAPWVFHRLSPLQLLNIWVPVQPLPCQPLVVMDEATLDDKNVFKHNLYRRDKPLIASLVQTHAPDQRWVVPMEWSSEMAVVFRTSWTPHSSSPVPGENLTAPLFEEIKRVKEHIETRLQEAKDIANNAGTFGVCGDINTDGLALVEGDSKEDEKELLEKVPVLRASLQEMRVTLRDLPRRCREIGTNVEKARTLADDLDKVLRRGMAMRVAIRVVALRWDPVLLVTSMFVLVGSCWYSLSSRHKSMK